MSESGDYNPGPWTGHDFKEARKSYDAHAGRSYEDALTSRRQGKDLVVKSLKTNSESPVVIACDVTGSMGEWPAVIFSIIGSPKAAVFPEPVEDCPTISFPFLMSGIDFC